MAFAVPSPIFTSEIKFQLFGGDGVRVVYPVHRGGTFIALLPYPPGVAYSATAAILHTVELSVFGAKYALGALQYQPWRFYSKYALIALLAFGKRGF